MATRKQNPDSHRTVHMRPEAPKLTFVLDEPFDVAMEITDAMIVEGEMEEPTRIMDRETLENLLLEMEVS